MMIYEQKLGICRRTYQRIADEGYYQFFLWQSFFRTEGQVFLGGRIWQKRFPLGSAIRYFHLMKIEVVIKPLAAVALALATALAHVSAAPAPEKAQPPLPTIELFVNEKSITAEVADDPHEQQAGLMFRDNLPSNSGMLFILNPPRRAAFWMKNTILPLSIAYINASGRILEIHDLEPGNEISVPSAFPLVAYALEMNQDWFRQAGILPGDRLTGLPQPALR